MSIYSFFLPAPPFPTLVFPHRSTLRAPCRGTATIKNGSSSKEAEVDAAASSQVEIVEEIKPQQVNHLIGKHMVLPFIPPKFINAADSNTLLKPSEYLKSICKSNGKNTLSKARWAFPSKSWRRRSIMSLDEDPEIFMSLTLLSRPLWKMFLQQWELILLARLFPYRLRQWTGLLRISQWFQFTFKHRDSDESILTSCFQNYDLRHVFDYFKLSQS